MFNFNNNCNEMISDYLMNKNALFRFRGLISIIIAILGAGLSEYLKLSKNSYINQLIIPISIFIVVLIVIEVLSKLFLSKDKRDMLRMKCKQMINNPNFVKNPSSYLGANHYKINMDKVAKYGGAIDGYHYSPDGASQTREKFELLDSSLRKKRKQVVVDDLNAFVNLDNVPTRVKEERMNNGLQVYSHTPVSSQLSLKYIRQDPLDPSDGKCLMENNCGFPCSGGNNKNCKVVAPVPGPQWQPQSAASVQNRLMNGNYTRPRCPEGGQVLREADCQNLETTQDCSPSPSTCVTMPLHNQ